MFQEIFSPFFLKNGIVIIFRFFSECIYINFAVFCLLLQLSDIIIVTLTISKNCARKNQNQFMRRLHSLTENKDIAKKTNIIKLL